MARKSFAFRRVEMMDNDHVPLDSQIVRNSIKARKNLPKDGVRPTVEKNAGEAQKNAPEGYVLSKKEW